MALVSYSDSEASDSEQENNVTQSSDKKQAPISSNTPKPSLSTAGTFQSIVDRSNPRKIRVALPEIKPENSALNGDEDGPARKKARIGGGGGAFSGFNSLLPAPKRKNATAEKEKKLITPARKVFSLKTGATPGFDREADAEMRNDMLGGDDDDETIPKAGSLRVEETVTGDKKERDEKKKEGELKLKGNPMVFKPLSVGRTQQKKKKLPATKATPSLPAADGVEIASQTPKEPATTKPTQPPVVQKPKISLFSLSTEESTTNVPGPQAHDAVYTPLVYDAEPAASAGPQPEPRTADISSETITGPTLDNIADDLNLSRAQRRQLFGRNADPSKSRVLHFNTDKEYIANQELAHQTDVATQHNPVRAIAPGKHTLQQLVNAASTQREALEESFATGRRNKEAGSKYGW